MNKDTFFLEVAIDDALNIARYATEVLAKIAKGEKLTIEDINQIGSMSGGIQDDAIVLAYQKEHGITL